MAKSKRLNVALPSEVLQVVQRMAQAQGVSQSAVIRDVLVEATPVLARVAAALAEVRAMEAERGAAIRAVLSEAEEEAERLAATAGVLIERVSRAVEAKPGLVTTQQRARGGQDQGERSERTDAQRPAAVARRRGHPPSC